MSVCNPCLKAKALPNCTQELAIGTISEINSSVTVYIQDITTGQIMLLPATSDGDGLVTVDISEKKFFDNHAYELWITDSGADYKDKMDITVGSTIKDTVCLLFEGVVSVSGEAELFVSQIVIEA